MIERCPGFRLRFAALSALVTDDYKFLRAEDRTVITLEERGASHERRMKSITAYQLRECRERLELSQGQFAKRFAVNRATINRYENGQQKIPLAFSMAVLSAVREAEEDLGFPL